MFKVGDEVSVKGEITKVLESGVVVKTHYFGEAYFDRSNMDVIGKTYEQGLADAWELAKKIATETKDGGIPCDDMCVMFGTDIIPIIFENFTFKDCLAKIEAYEKEKEIKETDVVEYLYKKWIVAEVRESEYRLWNGEKIECADRNKVKKVGSVESIEPLAELLRQIGE